MDNRLSAILKSKIEVIAVVADRLARSVLKARTLNLESLDINRVRSLTDDEIDVIDAYIFRYGSLISNIQDSVFKAIGDLEEEPVADMSNRDKTNLMERIGALPSAEHFSILAVLRNKLMHTYPEEAQKQLERINFITGESPRLLEMFVSIVKYAEKFGIFISLAEFKNITMVCSAACERCHSNPCVCSKPRSPS
ncbi:hypothetical protein AAKU67_000021 [Oxalobacteraceae bacterium GrIS 2.11]